MRNAVQQCLAANNILLMRKENRAFLLLAIALAWKFNDKTIIELGYRKISWFASISQISYLPKPNNWSVRPQSIHDILLNLVQ